MNIIELLTKAGPENVKVQSVASSLVGVSRKIKDAEITIATEHGMASSVMRESEGIPGTHVGLLVWIPRDKI